MNKNKTKFRLDDGPEKTSRLDVRVTDTLRAKLVKFCKDNRKFLTDAVTEALESYLKSQKAE